MNIKFLYLIMIIYNTTYASSSHLPPSTYVDKGACPPECCKYGDWVANSDMDLTSHISGSRIVDRIFAGEKVKALTGEVHTIPNEVEVIKDHEKFKIGDKIYLLTSQSEGFYQVWFNGKISSDEILFPGFTKNDDFIDCDVKKANCWGRIKNLKRNSVWWVKIQKTNGSQGWTKRSRAFSGQVRC